MKKLKHQHIISLLMDIDTATNMYLVLELVHGGDLFDAITRVTRFSETQSKIMIKHLASALAYLHAMSIVHRDVKPENLLVSDYCAIPECLSDGARSRLNWTTKEMSSC